MENYTAFEAMMKEEVLMSKNEDYYVYLYSMFCIRTKKSTFTHSAVQNFALFEKNYPMTLYSLHFTGIKIDHFRRLNVQIFLLF